MKPGADNSAAQATPDNNTSAPNRTPDISPIGISVSAADMASVCKMGVGQYSNAESHGAGLTFDRLHSIGRTLGTTVDFVTAGLTD